MAAGIFLWGPRAPSPQTDLAWAESSWCWYKHLLDLAEPTRTGVSRLPVYLWSRHHQHLVERRFMHTFSPVYRDCTDRELNLALPEGEFRFGKYLHTMQIDMDVYLQYLRDKFTSKGQNCRIFFYYSVSLSKGVHLCSEDWRVLRNYQVYQVVNYNSVTTRLLLMVFSRPV